MPILKLLVERKIILQKRSLQITSLRAPRIFMTTTIIICEAISFSSVQIASFLAMIVMTYPNVFLKNVRLQLCSY